MGMQVVTAPGNGFCFFEAIRIALQKTLNQQKTTKEIVSQVKDHIYQNVEKYASFHTGNNRKLLKDVKKFIKSRSYTDDVVDICVQATANALKINFAIYQQDNGNMQIYNQVCTDEMVPDLICLKYSREGGQSGHISDHYDAIVSCAEVPVCGNLPAYRSPNVTNSQMSASTTEEPTDAGMSESGYPDESSDTALSAWHTDGDTSATEHHQDNSSTHTPVISLTSDDDISILDSEDSLTTPKKRPKKLQLDMEIFNDVQVQHVECLPYDVNGTNIYQLACTKDTWNAKQRDGRWFQMHSSTRRNFYGIRKIGTCEGSYICTNADCPKVKSGKDANMYSFHNKGAMKICTVCGFFADRKYCGAVKMTEFFRNGMKIYHHGDHNCLLKKNKEHSDAFIMKHLGRNQRAGPKELKIDTVGQCVAQGDFSKAREAACLMNDTRRIHHLKSKMQEYTSDGSSFEAVGDFKKTTDADDEMLIYKMNNKDLNGEPSYVFKSSTKMAQLAIEMDIESTHVNVMQEEPVFFDGMHKRVKGYKTLSAWTYSPLMCRVLRLATMEAEHEDTENITLFWKLFNEVLQKVSGRSGYKFNPCKFIVDENGANINAIYAVYGKSGLKRTASCLFHFKDCARKQLKNINSDERDTFMALVSQQAKAVTQHEYDTATSALGKICARNENSGWLSWWSARKYHIIPAFRGFNIPLMNEAETGQTTLKLPYLVKLVDAAWLDTTTMVCQEEDYRLFMENQGVTSGRGLNQRQRIERERKAEKRRAQSYSEAYRQGDMYKESNPRQAAGADFIASKNAKHKVPKRFPRKNPIQGRSTSKGRKNTSNCAQPPTTPTLIDNPPTITFIGGLVSRCYGCKILFDKSRMQPPRDMVFRMKTYRNRPDGHGGWVKNNYLSNAYFHLGDMGCLRNERPSLRSTDVYMENCTYSILPQSHKAYLQQLGYWDTVQTNRLLRSTLPVL
jgi:hypothetical protein